MSQTRHFPLPDPPPPVAPTVTDASVVMTHGSAIVTLTWSEAMLVDPVDPSKWVLHVAGDTYTGGSTWMWVDDMHLQVTLPWFGPSLFADALNYMDSPSDVSSALGAMYPATMDIPFSVV
jgi:hypothetical protein